MESIRSGSRSRLSSVTGKLSDRLQLPPVSIRTRAMHMPSCTAGSTKSINVSLIEWLVYLAVRSMLLLR